MKQMTTLWYFQSNLTFLWNIFGPRWGKRSHEVIIHRAENIPSVLAGLNMSFHITVENVIFKNVAHLSFVYKVIVRQDQLIKCFMHTFTTLLACLTLPSSVVVAWC